MVGQCKKATDISVNTYISLFHCCLPILTWHETSGQLVERDLSTLGSCFLSPLRVSLRNLNNIHRGKREILSMSYWREIRHLTVMEASGNKKTGASTGCLEDRKGRSRLSRYAAEATAEHVGRSARKMGLRSVVMKVKGASFFKKKKVILSWREGFRGERVRDQSPVMYIHDVTQLPHNGCRSPNNAGCSSFWSGGNLEYK